MKVTVHVVVQAGDDTDAPTVVREVLSGASPRSPNCCAHNNPHRRFNPEQSRLVSSLA
ncbi:MAG: hypothetical protein ACRDQY_14850 [Pseudonocardiaceae bacterium]